MFSGLIFAKLSPASTLNQYLLPLWLGVNISSRWVSEWLATTPSIRLITFCSHRIPYGIVKPFFFFSQNPGVLIFFFVLHLVNKLRVFLQIYTVRTRNEAAEW